MLISTNASSQPLLNGSDTKSDSDSLQSGGPSRKLSLSALSQSPSVQSRSSKALQAPAKKKAKGFLNFLTIKEPSNKALEEFAEQQQRELKERGLDYPFGISTSKLPEHVPKVNSKWDGLPDDKRDVILAAEKQKKKVKPLVDQRKRSMSTGNPGKAALYASHDTPTFVPPSSHRSRHSIGSANTHTTFSSNSQSYKSCDPNARRPQVRSSSEVPFLDGLTYASGSTNGSVASPSRYMKFNRSNDDGSTQSDSDVLSSSEDWMPQTPCTPPHPWGNGRRKSAPIIVPLTSPFEPGMHNVAPLMPFLTEARDFEPRAVTRRPDIGVSMRSTANTGSAFLAGEAQELDLSDDLADEQYSPRKAKSTDIQANLPRQWSLSATATAEKSSFAGNPASPEKHFRTHQAGRNSDASRSIAQLPEKRLGRGDKVKKDGTFRGDPLDVWPPPPKDPPVVPRNKFRRAFFGKN
jgi:hypothetical protein